MTPAMDIRTQATTYGNGLKATNGHLHHDPIENEGIDLAMQLFGYEQNGDEETLLQLSEATIKATPDELRCIADFVREAADNMEQYGDRFGHEHVRFYCEDHGIQSVSGTADLIVAR